MRHGSILTLCVVVSLLGGALPLGSAPVPFSSVHSRMPFRASVAFFTGRWEADWGGNSCVLEFDSDGAYRCRNWHLSAGWVGHWKVTRDGLLHIHEVRIPACDHRTYQHYVIRFKGRDGFMVVDNGAKTLTVKTFIVLKRRLPAVPTSTKK